jgi:hypothetical protein
VRVTVIGILMSIVIIYLEATYRAASTATAATMGFAFFSLLLVDEVIKVFMRRSKSHSAGEIKTGAVAPAGD